jgi:hypothetical protein
MLSLLHATSPFVPSLISLASFLGYLLFKSAANVVIFKAGERELVCSYVVYSHVVIFLLPSIVEQTAAT